MEYKSKVGGILSIVAGALGIVGSFFSLLFIVSSRTLINNPTIKNYPYLTQQTFDSLVRFYTTVGIVLLVTGIIAIVGGSFSTNKRLWGLALIGSISGIFAFFPLGIIATIFITQARHEP